MMLDYGPDAILMKGLDGQNWRLQDYEARDGYALKKILRKNKAGRSDRRAEEVRLARTRRRRVPHRPQVVVHAARFPGAKYVVCNSDEGEPAPARTAICCATTRTR